MLQFFLRRSQGKALGAALEAAIAWRHVDRIDALLDRHGSRQFARAVSLLPPRVAADVLSVLSDTRRLAVLAHLPRHICAGLPFGQAREAAAPRPRAPLQGLLVHLGR